MHEEPLFCPRCGGPISRRVVKAGEPHRAYCTTCERAYYTGPKLAAGAICTRGSEILMVRRAIEPGYGLWVYPGGFVDLDESPAEAAARESYEEAGVHVEIGALVGVYHAPKRSVVLVVYAARIAGGEARACDETLEIQMVTRESIPWAELAFETTRQALSDFVSMYR